MGTTRVRSASGVLSPVGRRLLITGLAVAVAVLVLAMIVVAVVLRMGPR